MNLAREDLTEAQLLLNEHGPAAAYDFLASRGSNYAVLANGVAKENTFAGIMAVSYKETCIAAGLAADYWTLHLVLKTMPVEEQESYWVSTLTRAGSFAGEVMIAGETLKEMASHGAAIGRGGEAHSH